MYAQYTAVTSDNVKRGSLICSTLLFFVIIAGMLILGLGALRFYSFRLECQLAQINDRITYYEKNISRYEQHMATLKSPSRIHTFASVNLGMQGTSNIATVTVASTPNANKNNQFDFAFIEQNNGLFKLMNLFSRRANAND